MTLQADSTAPDPSKPTMPDAFDLLEQQAEEFTAQAKSVRVLDWIVRSVCDPHSLVH